MLRFQPPRLNESNFVIKVKSYQWKPCHSPGCQTLLSAGKYRNFCTRESSLCQVSSNIYSIESYILYHIVAFLSFEVKTFKQYLYNTCTEINFEISIIVVFMYLAIIYSSNLSSFTASGLCCNV